MNPGTIADWPISTDSTDVLVERISDFEAALRIADPEADGFAEFETLLATVTTIEGKKIATFGKTTAGLVFDACFREGGNDFPAGFQEIVTEQLYENLKGHLYNAFGSNQSTVSEILVPHLEWLKLRIQAAENFLATLKFPADHAVALIPFLFLEDTDLKGDHLGIGGFLEAVSENVSQISDSTKSDSFYRLLFSSSNLMFYGTFSQLAGNKKSEITYPNSVLNVENVGVVVDLLRFAVSSLSTTDFEGVKYTASRHGVNNEKYFEEICGLVPELKERFYSGFNVMGEFVPGIPMETTYENIWVWFKKSTPKTLVYHPLVEMGLYVRGMDNGMGDFDTETLASLYV